MTPAARVSAAIEILDAVLDGARAETALTRWGRAYPIRAMRRTRGLRRPAAGLTWARRGEGGKRKKETEREQATPHAQKTAPKANQVL